MNKVEKIAVLLNLLTKLEAKLSKHKSNSTKFSTVLYSKTEFLLLEDYGNFI